MTEQEKPLSCEHKFERVGGVPNGYCCTLCKQWRFSKTIWSEAAREAGWGPK